MKPLYESWNPTTRRSTEVVLDSDTGLPLIVHVQDVRPILENNRRLSNNYDPHAPNPHGWTKVASVPRVIWDQWRRLGITRDERALNAVLDNPENRYLRTDGGRRLT